ncbi:MAG: diguanylate cyclase [Bacillota bacterium]|nr:MAG: diguanylate cyclase [Bacillota bacterium]
MSEPVGDSARVVIVFEDGLRGPPELSSAVEATLRHAAEAERVTVAVTEGEVADALVSSNTVLVVVDADRTDALSFDRFVASLRASSPSRWLPVLAMASSRHLPVLHEAFRLPLVDFILKPFDPDELWSRIRVCLMRASLVRELEQRNEDLARRSMTDSLTGLLNTACVVERCDDEIGRAKRYGHQVSCLLVDVDCFKRVNDDYGHPAGNEVLVALARLLRTSVRGSDAVGRYGGEEFLLVLPETDRHGGAILAERLRRAIGESVFRIGPHEVRVTVSIGGATFPGDGIIGRETLLRAVDQAVYQAKAEGRNRVAWLVPTGSAEEGESEVGWR